MNLFEKDDTNTVDIPDFVEDKDSTESTSVDMSIFKMSDDELYDDEPKKKVSQTPSSNEPTLKKKSNSTIILCLVLIGVLLVTAAVSVIYAFKEHSSKAELEATVSQLTAQNNDLQNTISTLNGQIADLNAKIEDQNKAGGTSDNKYPAGTKLRITFAGSAQGLTLKADADSGWVENNDGTKKMLYEGDIVTIVSDSIKDSKGNYWGKINDGFMRIEYDNGIDDTIWAEVVE